ncbi:MAG TPA: GH25 family lysozyme [Methyloceanibacter sp.]
MTLNCRSLAMVGSFLLLAACPGSLSARSVKLADAKPHEGVASAHTMKVQGIDVSAWQGKIDWGKARAAGTRFAFIKATEGGDHLDPKFLENWEGAKRAGVARSAYHFLYWCRPAHEQALWFMLNVPADADALPPVLDLEWNTHSKTCPKKISRAKALEKIKAMLVAMESHTGKKPIIYTDPLFHREVLEGELTDYHFWLRSVAAEPQDKYANRRWTFWQFTTTGKVPGIAGKVDRNVYGGDDADWDRVLESLYANR